MFTKASLVLIVALLVAILVNQRSQGVVQAQAQIEYKVVDHGILVTPDGKPASFSSTRSRSWSRRSVSCSSTGAAELPDTPWTRTGSLRSSCSPIYLSRSNARMKSAAAEAS
jgi:hypothetical protein